MYDGIVQEIGKVVALDRPSDHLLTYQVSCSEAFLADLAVGASVSVDGVCQTVVSFDENRMEFQAGKKTLELTTLDRLQSTVRVNLARSMATGDEIGGHPIAGHVDGVVTITSLEASEEQLTVEFSIPESLRQYVFVRGFIALQGASLTVASYDVESGTAEVHLIPETLRKTTFLDRKVGDGLNLEIDRQAQVMVDSITRVIQTTLPRR